MGCGCQGSGAPKVKPPPREKRVIPPREPGTAQGAVGSKNYYYDGPARAPKPED